MLTVSLDKEEEKEGWSSLSLSLSRSVGLFDHSVRRVLKRRTAAVCGNRRREERYVRGGGEKGELQARGFLSRVLLAPLDSPVEAEGRVCRSTVVAATQDALTRCSLRNAFSHTPSDSRSLRLRRRRG